jgi:mycothiol synthase
VPTPLEPPAPPPGLSWRPPTPGDVAALTRHVLRVDGAEHLEHVPGAESFLWLMRQPDFDVATEWIVGFDADGEARAHAAAWTQATDAGSRSFLWFEADPGHEDLKPFLMSWAEAVGRRGLARGMAPRVLRVPVEEHRAGHRRVVEEAGFEAGRSFALMEVPLAEVPSPGEPPAEITVEAWTPELDEGARLANNEAFADHWGSLPMTAAEWTAGYVESTQFRPDLSFLAVEGDRVVGFCLTEVDEEHATDGGAASPRTSCSGHWPRRAPRVSTGPAWRWTSRATPAPPRSTGGSASPWRCERSTT